MSIAGTWSLTQSIDGATFNTEFAANGTVTVPGAPFVGTWSQPDATSVQFAIMENDGSSATLYQGTVSADSMQGTQRSLNQAGTSLTGTWSASPVTTS